MLKEHAQEIETKKFTPWLYGAYSSYVRGRSNSSFGVGLYREIDGPLLKVVGFQGSTPICMAYDHLRQALHEMVWIKEPNRTLIFWKLESDPDRGLDFVIRDVTKEKFYFEGRQLFLKSNIGNKETEAIQVGFGFDFGGIHYCKKESLLEKGVKLGNMNLRVLTEYLSSK